MRTKFIGFVIWTGLVCHQQLFAQKKLYGENEIKVSYYMDQENYPEAIHLLAESIKTYPKNSIISINLARAYFNIGEWALSTKWYDYTLFIEGQLSQQDLFNYETMLSETKRFDSFAMLVEDWNSRINSDSMRTYSYATDFLTQPALPSIQFISDSMMIFAKKDSTQFSLYLKNLKSKDLNTPAKLIIGTKDLIKEGVFSIASESMTLYFLGKDGRIYQTQILGDSVSSENLSRVSMPRIKGNINQMAVSLDNKNMVLSITWKKTKTGADLYLLAKDENNAWSTMTLLSAPINSAQDELHPSFTGNGVLNFSSNREGGQGGLDLYSTNLSAPLVSTFPEPINSKFDETKSVFFDHGKHFSSTRNGSESGWYTYHEFQMKIMKADSSTVGHQLNIYLSDTTKIQYRKNHYHHLTFDFSPHKRYSLSAQYYQYYRNKLEKDDRPAPKMTLSEKKVYTFHMHELLKEFSQREEPGQQVLNAHIDQGDLIIFKLIPQKKDSTKYSKFTHEGIDVPVRMDREIVFGYKVKDGLDSERQFDSLRRMDRVLPDITFMEPKIEIDKPERYVPVVPVDSTETVVVNDPVVEDVAIDSLVMVASQPIVQQESTSASANKEDSVYNQPISSQTDYAVPDTKLKNNDQPAESVPKPVLYRVQIAAAVREIGKTELKRIYSKELPVKMFREAPYFKYYIIETPSFDTAKKTLNACNVKGAFIVAYQGDYKLSPKELYHLRNAKKEGHYSKTSRG